MQEFTRLTDDGFIWRRQNEQVWITTCGRNGLRVRITHEATFRDLPQGLLDEPLVAADAPRIAVTDDAVTMTNGAITVSLTTRLGRLAFSRSSDGEILLHEQKKTTAEHLGRTFMAERSAWRIEQRFEAQADEKLYGLGQRQHGFLDQKGCILDLMHRNTEVSIPFMVSSRGYGFLWNHPGIGQLALGRNDTRWTARQAYQLDYYVVVDDSPAAIVQRYSDVTGRPSPFPEWAAGFWQCKLRYKTQDELLEVAREYHRRQLPVSVMVIDFHHWSKSGDWAFDPECWPDPAAMVRELREMGMKCMVSIWPTVDHDCDNYAPMANHGLLLRNERGMPLNNGAKVETFYDATHPEARRYLWQQVEQNYVAHGIRYFWLDTIEPEIIPLEFDNTRFHIGNGNEVAGLYPRCHQQAFFEGLRSVGEEAPLTLGRSAWVGSQRYGAAIWSADIPSTWDSLQRQVNGGLNIGLTGIPWWTTDIGGFHGGDIDDPAFHELLIRWFQYGVFCPIMRLHGIRRQQATAAQRARIGKADPNHPNVPNEVWSYGEDVCEILSAQLHLRERLRPYIMRQMQHAEATGLPPMRPLFMDFPADPQAWEVEDQFLFGPDILVAPILAPELRQRPVYLPAGSRWRDAWSGQELDGGQTVTADAPIQRIPVYLRADSDLKLTP